MVRPSNETVRRVSVKAGPDVTKHDFRSTPVNGPPSWSGSCQFRKSGPRSWYRVVGRYAATFFFVTTVMTQRAGRLDATSLTERTNPVTTEPSIVNVALWFRYWANRQRRARF